MRKATLTLTNAQIKALPTTPIAVVAGVAGKIIVPHLILCQADDSAGAYTNVDAGPAGYLSFLFTQEISDFVWNDFLFGGASKSNNWVTPRHFLNAQPPTLDAVYTWGAANAQQLAADLQVKDTNASGNFTGGNAANSLKITVWYELVAGI